MAYNCNNGRRKGQKDKREGVPMYDEWPAKEAERFDLYGNLTKSKEIQGNCDMDKINNVSPFDQLANQVLVASLLADKIVDIYKKYLGNRGQYEIIYEVSKQRFFVHAVLLCNLSK